MRKHFAISLVVLVSACGGNLQQDLVCHGDDAVQNWRQRGYDTATAGKNIRTFDQLKTRCRSEMPRETRTAFIDGYTQGALDFCTYEKGYDLGFKNYDMPTVCPFEIRAEFARGYKEGNLAYMDTIKRFEKAQDDFTDDIERSKRLNDEAASQQ